MQGIRSCSLHLNEKHVRGDYIFKNVKKVEKKTTYLRITKFDVKTFEGIKIVIIYCNLR